MINNALVLPILIPLLAGTLLSLWRSPSYFRRVFSLSAFFAQFWLTLSLLIDVNSSGIKHILTLGGWKAPIGIMLNGDILGLTIVAISVVIYLFGSKRISSENGLILPLIHFICAGINLSFLTGDIFNLFVAFEIMLLASYALMTLETDKSTTKNAFPYLTINLLGSTVFLCAAGLYYSLFGTLNFASISIEAANFIDAPRLFILSILMICVFGLKAGIFPMYYWLPISYPMLPTPIAALFAGLLTKVGIYALIRVFCTVFPVDALTASYELLMLISIPTMVIPILGAIISKDIFLILCFNLMSHIGFMIAAIGLYTPESLTAGFLYMIHHVIVIASLFLIAGIIIKKTGTRMITKMGGLWKRSPLLGVLFLIQALALVGIPPLSGFWGKLMLLQSSAIGHSPILIISILIASILTLLSMVKIWFYAFCNSQESEEPEPTQIHAVLYGAIGILIIGSLAIGLNPRPVYNLTKSGISMAQHQTQYQLEAESSPVFKKEKKGYSHE